MNELLKKLTRVSLNPSSHTAAEMSSLCRQCAAAGVNPELIRRIHNEAYSPRLYHADFRVGEINPDKRFTLRAAEAAAADDIAAKLAEDTGCEVTGSRVTDLSMCLMRGLE